MAPLSTPPFANGGSRQLFARVVPSAARATSPLHPRSATLSVATDAAERCSKPACHGTLTTPPNRKL
nr:unnamed protein product [Digitaria exilis]